MAIDPDGPEPAKPPTKPADLTLLGVAELEAYVTELKAEIARAEAVIAAKQSHRTAADALFKPSSA